MKKIIAVLAIASAAFSQMVTIDYPHKEIHEGKRFKSVYTNVIGSGAVANFIIATTNTALFRALTSPQFHLTVTVASAAAADFIFVEAPTHVGVGTAVASYNRNRQSSYTPWANCFLSTNCTGGTILYAGVLGSSGGGTRGSGEAGTRAEIILKTNTLYNVQFTSRAAGNIFMIEYDWYEQR